MVEEKLNYEKSTRGSKYYTGRTIMNMSFVLTTRQYEDRTKTVTRRLGWSKLKAGQCFTGVKKGQGLKKGEKVKRLHDSIVVSNTREPLYAIGGYPKGETAKEGFPDMTPQEFVDMFCKHNKCLPETVINQIEFKHL